MIRILTRYCRHPVLFVTGRVVGDDADYLKTALLDLVDIGYDAISLELGDVVAIDNVGTAALLSARARLAQIGGSLRLVNCSLDVQEDLQKAGIYEVFPVFGRLEDVPSPYP